MCVWMRASVCVVGEIGRSLLGVIFLVLSKLLEAVSCVGWPDLRSSMLTYICML